MALEKITCLNELLGMNGTRRSLDETSVVLGLRFQPDPEAGFEGEWESAADRLIMLRAQSAWQT